ncbi:MULTISPECIES: LysM domain-containing protein [Acidobacteriaceae]|uniref:LysM peptidoglycan-binding domain-containing protein n=1 Tax=Acidobacteriaceae TaxID=204434 RepID=UPI00131BCAF4|nr:MULTISPECIES: LysM domain-containing protein [Acidobacteriaceae]MDW5265458.1 LysM domain-containing protein [Edaphobacter sp.]
MNYPLQTLIQLGVVPSVSFPTDSRYYGSATLQYTAPNGEVITYLARRFVPQPGAPNFATIAQHTVHQGDRLDLIAAKYLGDPLIFWLLCDANGAIAPNDLLANPGHVLAIVTPQGVPGVPNT